MFASDSETVFVYKSKKWWAITMVCTLLPLTGALTYLGISSSRAVEIKSGDAGCPCINAYPSAVEPITRLSTRVQVEGVERHYPRQYGLHKCAAHDEELKPYCDGAASPSWCASEWCYVSSTNCDKAFETSVYFSAAKLTFSYATCGSVPDDLPIDGYGTQAGR